MLYRFSNIELRYEVSKFIRENTELIVNNLQDQCLQWSRELI